MSKGLEAFERIKNITYDRTDLYGIGVFRKDLAIIEKELKALEIIKREPVETISDVLSFKNFDAMFRHYRNSGEFPYIKTETEFNLLKEVLL